MESVAAVTGRRGSAMRRWLRTKQYRQTGSLYGPAFDDAQRFEILERLEAEHGPMREVDPDAWEVIVHNALERWRESMGTMGEAENVAQQNAWLFQVDAPDSVACSECGDCDFRWMLGCVRCLQVVCGSCYLQGHHVCPENWEATWTGDETEDRGELLAHRIGLMEVTR